ncbi:hypothetical protein [Micromonospora chersina]|uniref:hypothetical protein n=1 Tax=Micromonospora chersina TaxID=47854 RepID=UPI0036882F8F
MYGRALLFGEQAEPQRAMSVLLDARRQGVDIGSPGHVSFCERHLAGACLALGHHRAAIDWVRSAVAQATQPPRTSSSRMVSHPRSHAAS